MFVNRKDQPSDTPNGHAYSQPETVEERTPTSVVTPALRSLIQQAQFYSEAFEHGRPEAVGTTPFSRHSQHANRGAINPLQYQQMMLPQPKLDVTSQLSAQGLPTLSSCA